MNNKKIKKVALVGLGSWGTALAYLASSNVRDIICHVQNIDLIEEINNKNLNTRYCADKVLPSNIQATDRAADLADVQAYIIAVPAQQLRSALTQLSDIISANAHAPVVLCSKGIENGSNQFMSQVVASLGIRNATVYLSGPNFAREILEDKPAAATVASHSKEALKVGYDIFSGENFLLETTEDINGVQLCGAIKNVYAIGAGIAYGLQLGQNFHASFVKIAIAEIVEILRFMNWNEETIFTYAGIGDLTLTCNSVTSRNMRFGALLAGEHQCRQEFLATQTVEGYHTTRSILELLSNSGEKSFNIVETLYNVLFKQAKVSSIRSLMQY